MTCSSPRRKFFLHALSFESTSKLYITLLIKMSVYFHIKKMHYTIQSLNCVVRRFPKILHSYLLISRTVLYLLNCEIFGPMSAHVAQKFTHGNLYIQQHAHLGCYRTPTQIMAMEQGEGGGGQGTGTGRILGGQQEGQVQGDRWVEGAWGDHENNLLLVGRVLRQVRLYGEREREGGGGQTETGTTIIDEGPRASSNYSSRVFYARRRVEDLQIIERGTVSYAPPPTPEPSTTRRTGRGANLNTSGRWTGNQGQNGIIRKSFGRLQNSNGRTTGDNRRCWRWTVD